MDLAEMLPVDKCRHMEELINLLSPIRIIVRMPEPDYFLRYCMQCNARNFITSGKFHVCIEHSYSPPVAAATRCFELLRRRKTVVGGKCALLSAVLVYNFTCQNGVHVSEIRRSG